MSPSKSIEFHPSQFPAAVQARWTDALRARTLPARFLYDSPAQARRWLAYHRAWSPGSADREVLALYDGSFDRAVEGFSKHDGLVHVSLGCGGGRKDARLAALCEARGIDLRPILSDTSPTLVLEAMLCNPRSDARGLVVDLEVEPARSAFSTSSVPHLWTALGMVPNLEYDTFLSWLGRVMGAEDAALVSANLHPSPYPEAGPDILPQYDNPEARAWYRGALHELGVDAMPTVDGRALVDDGSIWRVEVTAELPANANLGVAETIPTYGGPLRLFFSNRFTPAGFERALKTAGLRAKARWIHTSEQEGIWWVAQST